MRNKFLTIFLGFLMVSVPLFAHHGAAAYDTSKKITVKATVTEWFWANPHCFLRFDAKDDKGNTVTAFNGQVTMSIGRQAGLLMPGKLSGTVTVAAVNGVARFSNLCIDQLSTPGDGYTLRATAPEVNLSVETARFSIGLL